MTDKRFLLQYESQCIDSSRRGGSYYDGLHEKRHFRCIVIASTHNDGSIRTKENEEFIYNIYVYRASAHNSFSDDGMTR